MLEALPIFLGIAMFWLLLLAMDEKDAVSRQSKLLQHLGSYLTWYSLLPAPLLLPDSSVKPIRFTFCMALACHTLLILLFSLRLDGEEVRWPKPFLNSSVAVTGVRGYRID